MLAAALLTFAPRAMAACQLLQIAEFPVVMYGNAPLVDGEINGRKVRFLVDTGSSTTLISIPAAAALGLQAVDTRQRLYGVGGDSMLGVVTVHELKLGTATVHDRPISVAGPGLKSRAYVGILGEDFLSHFDLELDFAKGVMRLIQPKDCSGDQVVFWGPKTYSVAPIASSANAGDLDVYVLLNGQRVLATLDTGAYTSVVTTDGAARAGVTPHSEGVQAVESSGGLGRGSEETSVAVFPTFTVGDETIKNAKLRIADLFRADKEVELGSHIPTAVADFPNMLLGADFIRAHHIYIARSQGKIYFTYNSGPIFQVIGEAPERREPAEAQPQP